METFGTNLKRKIYQEEEKDEKKQKKNSIEKGDTKGENFDEF